MLSYSVRLLRVQPIRRDDTGKKVRLLPLREDLWNSLPSHFTLLVSSPGITVSTGSELLKSVVSCASAANSKSFSAPWCLIPAWGTTSNPNSKSARANAQAVLTLPRFLVCSTMRRAPSRFIIGCLSCMASITVQLKPLQEIPYMWCPRRFLRLWVTFTNS